MSRCDAPPVHSLQDAVLTCHFPEDLSVSKKGFTVYHYVNRESAGEETYIKNYYCAQC